MNQPPGGPPPGNEYGGPPAYGQPPAPGQYGQPPGYGPQQPFGITPLPRSNMGMWIGLGGAVVGLVVAVVVVAVNVGGLGLGSASKGNGVCAQAVRCCEMVTAGKPSAANCKNLGKIGVPDAVCEQTLDSMRSAARSQGKTCH